MEQIYIYIMVGAGALFVAILFALILAHWYKATYEDRRKKREQKRLEKLKWKYANIKNGNPLLEKIVSSRFIIFMGGLGKGKSILMNLTAHYLYEKQEDYNKKHKRFNRVMLKDYVLEYEKLKEQKKLPIYSNLDFVLNEKKTKLKSQDLIPFITLQRRAIQRCVFCIDEVASLFPKDMYYENQANPDPMVDEMKELFKKGRHFTDGWFLGTEQDGQDIFIGFRKNGYALVTALGTVVTLSKKGKRMMFWKNFANMFLPAFLTQNAKKLVQKQVFLKDKIWAVFKALLPSYFFFPKEYYTKKQKIAEKVKAKHQQYTTHLAFEGFEYYIRFKNEDIFQYDTRAYKNEYSQKFDKSGNRKLIQEV